MIDYTDPFNLSQFGDKVKQLLSDGSGSTKDSSKKAETSDEALDKALLL